LSVFWSPLTMVGDSIFMAVSKRSGFEAIGEAFIVGGRNRATAQDFSVANGLPVAPCSGHGSSHNYCASKSSGTDGGTSMRNEPIWSGVVKSSGVSSTASAAILNHFKLVTR